MARTHQNPNPTTNPVTDLVLDHNTHSLSLSLCVSLSLPPTLRWSRLSGGPAATQGQHASISRRQACCQRTGSIPNSDFQSTAGSSSSSEQVQMDLVIDLSVQVNLEYLGHVFNNGGMLYPDNVVSTDSHTTLIDGLGVTGLGVGGIEAEAVMLGQMSMVLPGGVGFKLSGKLKNGVIATDLVLTVTQMLRKHGVVGKFVEFYALLIYCSLPLYRYRGRDEQTITGCATIANMSPEYGATMGFFPVDHVTLQYWKLTGISDETVAMIESYL